ncbi:hypothetical protein [Nocardioides hungaricus]
MVIAAVAASLLLWAVLLATATTPTEARRARAAPDLPAPTIAVEEGSRPGLVAVPGGAIVTDETGRSLVIVHDGGVPRRVPVREVGEKARRLVEVRAEGLEAGDLVELVSLADAAAPPR